MTSLSAFAAKYDALIAEPIVPDTTTENGGAAFSSTGSACLDFFTRYVRGTSQEDIINMFVKAYGESPYIALKILFNGRDCIGDGKQEKLITFYIMNYLKRWKPKTYVKNLIGFTKIGCFKDLLQLDLMTKLAPINPAQNDLLLDIELQLMAAILKDDLVKLSAGESVSLMAKWAPTERCEFDLKTRAAHRLSKILGCKDMKEYRKKYLTPLRAKIDVLERLESARRWDEIKFEKVPATAMKKQKAAFQKHCSEGFMKYLSNVVAGRAKMNSKGIQPHDLVMNPDETANAQWIALVVRLSSAGVFKSCLPWCDVSDSMQGIPMFVSIAMGILMSSLTEGRFKDRVLTFSEVPQWHTIVGTTLAEKVASLSQANWGASTNFIGAFEMILDEAFKYELTQEQMPKKIIVFTDMQFNAAHQGDYKTAYEIISAKYSAAGYKIPQLVFWNLRDSKVAFPVQKDTPGVALMSGYSAEMLKMFMDDEDMTPYSMMMKALKPYEVFVVDE
jgi:hypothetical protein